MFVFSRIHLTDATGLSVVTVREASDWRFVFRLIDAYDANARDYMSRHEPATEILRVRVFRRDDAGAVQRAAFRAGRLAWLPVNDAPVPPRAGAGLDVARAAV